MTPIESSTAPQFATPEALQQALANDACSELAVEIALGGCFAVRGLYYRLTWQPGCGGDLVPAAIRIDKRPSVRSLRAWTLLERSLRGATAATLRRHIEVPLPSPKASIALSNPTLTQYIQGGGVFTIAGGTHGWVWKGRARQPFQRAGGALYRALQWLWECVAVRFSAAARAAREAEAAALGALAGQLTQGGAPDPTSRMPSSEGGPGQALEAPKPPCGEGPNAAPRTPYSHQQRVHQALREGDITTARQHLPYASMPSLPEIVRPTEDLLLDPVQLGVALMRNPGLAEMPLQDRTGEAVGDTLAHRLAGLLNGGDPVIWRILCGAGRLNPDAANKQGQTLLHVLFLKQAGLQTAYQIEVSARNLCQVLAVLLDPKWPWQPHNIRSSDGEGRSVWHLAAKYLQPASLERLIGYAAATGQLPADSGPGTDSLIAAAIAGLKPENARLLIRHRVVVRPTGKDVCAVQLYGRRLGLQRDNEDQREVLKGLRREMAGLHGMDGPVRAGEPVTA